ncbi:hypothetical protein Tco_1097138 [Tanacetum coccineum]
MKSNQTPLARIRAANYLDNGGIIGVVSTDAFAWKYLKSPHMNVVETYIRGKKIDPAKMEHRNYHQGLYHFEIGSVAQNTTRSVFLPEGGSKGYSSGLMLVVQARATPDTYVGPSLSLQVNNKGRLMLILWNEVVVALLIFTLPTSNSCKSSNRHIDKRKCLHGVKARHVSKVNVSDVNQQRRQHQQELQL